jgi:hypothetical protein
VCPGAAFTRPEYRREGDELALVAKVHTAAGIDLSPALGLANLTKGQELLFGLKDGKAFAGVRPMPEVLSQDGGTDDGPPSEE